MVPTTLMSKYAHARRALILKFVYCTCALKEREVRLMRATICIENGLIQNQEAAAIIYL